MEKELNIVNLTNQDIKIYPVESYSDILTYEPIKKEQIKTVLERCETLKSNGSVKAQLNRDRDYVKATINKTNKIVTLSYTSIGAIPHLPDEKDGTIYIVSQLCFNAIHHLRKDVWITDKPLRTVDGKVIACMGFSRCTYDLHVQALEPVRKYLERRLLDISNESSEFINIQELLINLNNYIKK